METEFRPQWRSQTGVWERVGVRLDSYTKIIIMGIPFDLWASGEFRQFINEFRTHWQPILEAQREGTRDIATLSKEGQEQLQAANIALDLAWLRAILDWAAIEPADLRCPTLWLVGSKNENTVSSISEYAEGLKASKVQTEVIEELNHMEEFTEIDKVLPVMLAFTVR